MGTLWKAALFGLVEGITEWLPVSSTGHMILLERWLPMEVTARFWETFLVVIQLGAVAAVVVPRFSERGPLERTGGLHLNRKILALWGKILLACVPAAVLELTVGQYLTALFYRPRCVAAALIAVGALFLLVERMNRRRVPRLTAPEQIDGKRALAIGLFQLLAAAFPGTSRSGATILGALLLGISRPAAASFSFYLAVPVMAGASLWKLLQTGLRFTGEELSLLLMGTVCAFAVSMAVIRGLTGFVRRRDFTAFAVYRIALGLLVLAVLA
jgi:undecaprenyl-diphosphatase